MTRFAPKLITCLREGYDAKRFLKDLTSGVTVGIIALPLAMAFGIASLPESVVQELKAINPALTPPAIGLFTAIVAGFIISALGGSRVQIGGPTGAFIVIVYRIAAEHGYAGLATATGMAGIILIVMGLAGFGRLIKFIPYPVTTGFTTGIAVVIATTQIKDLFGLRPIDEVGNPVPMPPDFIPKLQVLAGAWDTYTLPTAIVGLASVIVLFTMRKLVPRVPGAIIVAAASAAIVYFFHIPTETIATRFGGIPRSMPFVNTHGFSLGLALDLIPEATTIAILCAIESLLSAVVADGMTGYHHRSDTELVAQGAANVAVSFLWGIPATGAIARTVANIRSGATSPVSGMVHAVTLLVILLVAGPLAKEIPLAALSAILMVVAWNMAELDHFRSILKSPRSDVVVLLTTFGLTVLTDLTIAVMVGMVLASFLFMRRMSDLTGVGALGIAENGTGESAPDTPQLPPRCEAYEVYGPLFFGTADRVKDTLAGMEKPPLVFILRMRHVLCIDATGLHAIEELHRKCKRGGTTLVLSGVHSQPVMAIAKSGLDQVIGLENMCGSIDEAIKRARAIVQAAGA
ncbi:MAG: STAS domain-containing protein [Phycisphaerales bacterium]|nr:STAS domain-containing protein [Phycisphaerales bacterium]